MNNSGHAKSRDPVICKPCKLCGHKGDPITLIQGTKRQIQKSSQTLHLEKSLSFQDLSRSGNMKVHSRHWIPFHTNLMSLRSLWWTLWVQTNGASSARFGFFWLTLFKDAYTFYKACNRCQMTGNIGPSNQMPQLHILVVEIFDVWGIYFMGFFLTLSATFTTY